MAFGIKCMRISLFGLAFTGFQVVSAQYYLAAGQAVKAMLLSILRPLLLMVPLIHIFSGPTADILTALIAAGLVGYDSRKKRKGV